MKIKKLFASILVLAMVLSTMGTAVFADETVSTWDGTTVDTSWYGDGTETSYTITTAAQIAGLAQLVNSGNTLKGKTILLDADIDLADKEWTPIGNSTNKFQGTFDGQEHTINNLVITGNNSNTGIFGFTTDGEIKNLTVNNAKVSGYLNVGVVAGTPYTSKYTNIAVTGHVEVNGFAYVGGVGGKNAYANWSNITVDVDDASYVNAVSTDEKGTAYRTYVGGVVGFNGEGGHTFKDIISNINVIGDVCDIGGVFGIAHYGNNFENITCSGNVTNNVSSSNDGDDAVKDVLETGLIAGVWHNEAGYTVTFKNISATGTISVPNVEGVTFANNGLIGNAYYATNNTAENSGSLSIDGENVWIKNVVAKIGEIGYTTLADAVANVKEGETITILAGAISEGTIKLLSTLKDVTFKGETGAIFKDMTIMASDGNSFSYIGLTFDGITFENSRLSFTGWRNGDEIIEDLTVTNCTFKNLYDDTNSACIHINKDVDEPVNGFTFTNNIIDGATGGKKSGIYTVNTGNVVITGNTFNNIVFRPALVQLADCDGIADNVVISDNVISNTTRLQVYGTEEGPDEGPWTPVGTDTLVIAINNNIFKNITGQYICTWGINGETDIAKNYYDSTELGGRIYWNNEEPTDEKGLAELGIYPVYTELDEDGTIDETSLYTPKFTVVFQTLTDGLISDDTAMISFNAFYNDYLEKTVGSYGMFIYSDIENNKGVRLDSENIALTDGWFNAVVEEIPSSAFNSVVVMKPFVVVDGEAIIGEAVEAKVSEF